MTDPTPVDPTQPPIPPQPPVPPAPPAGQPAVPPPPAAPAVGQPPVNPYAPPQPANPYAAPAAANPYAPPAYGQQPYGQAPTVNPYATPVGGPWPYATHPADAPTPGVGFVQAIKLFFRKYAQFSGRASRSEYWWVALFLGLVALVLYVPGIMLLSFGGIVASDNGAGGGIMIALGVILVVAVVLFFLGTLVPSIAIAVRRLHDANFSGLFYLLSLAGLSIVVLVMNILESNPQGQRFDRPI